MGWKDEREKDGKNKKESAHIKGREINEWIQKWRVPLTGEHRTSLWNVGLVFCEHQKCYDRWAKLLTTDDQCFCLWVFLNVIQHPAALWLCLTNDVRIFFDLTWLEALWLCLTNDVMIFFDLTWPVALLSRHWHPCHAWGPTQIHPRVRQLTIAWCACCLPQVCPVVCVIIPWGMGESWGLDDPLASGISANGPLLACNLGLCVSCVRLSGLPLSGFLHYFPLFYLMFAYLLM